MYLIKNITIGSYKDSFNIKSETDSVNESVNSFNELLKEFQLNNILNSERFKIQELNNYITDLENEYNTKVQYFNVSSGEFFNSIIFYDEFELQRDSNINEIWERHYKPLEDIDLENQFIWSFTMTILDGTDLKSNQLEQVVHDLQLNMNDFQDLIVENNSYIGICNWNGCLIIKKNPSDDMKIIFQFILNCLKWDVAEKTQRKILSVREKMFIDIKAAKTYNKELLKLSSDFGYYNMILNKDLVSYDQEDIDIHVLFSKGWDTESLSKSTVNHLDETTEIINLSDSIHSLKAQENTNVFLNYLAVIGLGGTIAGIISTVDFSNDIMSSSVFRFILIFFVAVISMVIITKINR